nr:divergent serine/threonine protein kinase [Cedratvirus lena]
MDTQGGNFLMYSYTVLLDGEETEFTGETKSDALCELDLYMEELLERKTQRNRPSYVKRRISHKLKYYQDEIKAYSRLADVDVCPRLLDHGIVFEYRIIQEKDSRRFYKTKPNKTQEHTYYAYYVDTELHGCSLTEEYSTIGTLCLDSRDVEKMFNFSSYPKFVRKQISGLVDKMHEAGVYHGDFHPGNLVIKDGVVKAIDFELCEFV